MKYGKIQNFQKMKIKVILNDQEVLYEGEVADAPPNIKDMYYSQVKLNKVTEIYVYDEEKDPN